MSRTDDLRGRGARDRTSGGGGAPFIKWGDNYEWVEGTVESVWQTQYGPAVTLMVTNATPGVQVQGKDEDGDSYGGVVKQSEEVNVGLNNKMLEDSITQQDVGGHFHIAFEGWQEPKKAGANRYRVFTVLEIEPPENRAVPGENVPTTEEVKSKATGMSREDPIPQTTPDDDLPF